MMKLNSKKNRTRPSLAMTDPSAQQQAALGCVRANVPRISAADHPPPTAKIQLVKWAALG
jgi:hypothetical protein